MLSLPAPHTEMFFTFRPCNKLKTYMVLVATNTCALPPTEDINHATAAKTPSVCAMVTTRIMEGKRPWTRMRTRACVRKQARFS